MFDFLIEQYSSVIVGLAVLLLTRLYIVYSIGICKSKNRIDGKTVIITGANAGIGKETALDLAKRGGRIILACRSVEKASIARDDIIEKSHNKNVVVGHLDLTCFKSIRKFAADIIDSEERVDILINNAGYMDVNRKWNKDGFEYQMLTNHFGHFLLTNLLLGFMKKSGKCRIINVASVANTLAPTLDLDNLDFKKDFSKNTIMNIYHKAVYSIYNTTKLCNILFTKEMARKVDPTGAKVTVNALHPGLIVTELNHSHILVQQLLHVVLAIGRRSKWQGAQTTIHLAVSDEVENITGEYFEDCQISKKIAKQALDEGLAKKLWEITENMVGLKPEERHF